MEPERSNAPVPYKLLGSDDQKILDALGMFMKKQGYTAAKGWKFGTSRYEVQSQEINAYNNQPKARAVIEGGKGFLVVPDTMIKISISNQENSIEIKEGWESQKNTRPRDQAR